MGADSPAVSSTVEHGGFTFSGTGAEDAVKVIQADEKAKAAKGKDPDPDPKAETSKAASVLGKQGGKAAAQARAAKQAETDKAEPANTEKDTKETAEPEKKAAATEGEEDEGLSQHPRAKARVEEATRKAKEAKEEAQRERDARVRLETRLEALERTSRPAERQPAAEESEAPSDEPQLETYLAKHPGAEAKAISEWVGDRDKWRDGQQTERQHAQRHVGHLFKLAGGLAKAIKEVVDTDEAYWPAVQGVAQNLVPSEGIDVKSGKYFRVEDPGPLNWLTDELHMDPKNAAHVLRHLASDPEDFETIKGYRSPRDVTRAVATIVAHMGGATAGETPPGERQVPKPASSMAPPPVRPVTGAPSTASGADPMPREGESFDSWNRRTGKRAATR